MPHNKKLFTITILLGWSLLFFLYTLLGVWLGTGQHALAGPSTSITDYLFSGLWLGFGVLQLTLAARLYKQYKPVLFWIVAVLAVLSLGLVVGPPLLALLFDNELNSGRY